jgi:7-cyano-7-deazaguanine synthase
MHRLAGVKVTVLCSGGTDSASCIHFLKDRGYTVSGVFVDFGQAAAGQEYRSVTRISSYFSIPLTIVHAAANQTFGSGELIGRNPFLIFCALFLGKCHEGLLALGIHAGTPYFDCSPAFVSRLEPLVLECTDGRVSVIAPFLHWSKDDVYSYFVNAKIPLSTTYSCEAGSDPPCSRCASCKDRARLECLQNVVH